MARGIQTIPLLIPDQRIAAGINDSRTGIYLSLTVSRNAPASPKRLPQAGTGKSFREMKISLQDRVVSPRLGGTPSRLARGQANLS